MNNSATTSPVLSIRPFIPPTKATQEMANDPKFRILMLHGFAASGQRFEAKARPISERIIELLTPGILHEFPGGIEFLYPDAPFALECPIGLGRSNNDEAGDGGKDKQNDSEVAKDQRDPFSRAWWYGRDTVNEYKGLQDSLLSLVDLIRERPIHGIFAFSQGAALAGMITSMLDCRDNPAKAAAIRAQGLPVDLYLALPGQDRLRFFVGCGGYQGTLKYYGSLYQWPIQTPSCHTLASMDAVVDDFLTLNLAHSFSSYELVHYYGSHFIPRDRATVETVARFVADNSHRPVVVSPPLSRQIPSKTPSTRDANSSRPAYKPTAEITIWRRARKTFAIRSRRRQAVSQRRPVLAFNHSCPVL